MASISDAQRVEANRQMGALVNRLLIEACPNETRAAFRENGTEALSAPFSALGEHAMVDIMGNADVNAGIAEMGSYIDSERLGALIRNQ